jgi:hypothetical protein
VQEQELRGQPLAQEQVQHACRSAQYTLAHLHTVIASLEEAVSAAVPGANLLDLDDPFWSRPVPGGPHAQLSTTVALLGAGTPSTTAGEQVGISEDGKGLDSAQAQPNLSERLAGSHELVISVPEHSRNPGMELPASTTRRKPSAPDDKVHIPHRIGGEWGGAATPTSQGDVPLVATDWPDGQVHSNLAAALRNGSNHSAANVLSPFQIRETSAGPSTGSAVHASRHLARPVEGPLRQGHESGTISYQVVGEDGALEAGKYPGDRVLANAERRRGPHIDGLKWLCTNGGAHVSSHQLLEVQEERESDSYLSPPSSRGGARLGSHPLIEGFDADRWEPS